MLSYFKSISRAISLLLLVGFTVLSLGVNQEVKRFPIKVWSTVDFKSGDKTGGTQYSLLEDGNFICSCFDALETRGNLRYMVQYNDKQALFDTEKWKGVKTGRCVQIVSTGEYAWVVLERETEKKRRVLVERWKAMDVINGSVDRENYTVFSQYVDRSLGCTPYIKTLSSSGENAILTLFNEKGQAGDYLCSGNTLKRLPDECSGCYEYNLDFLPYIHCQPYWHWCPYSHFHQVSQSPQHKILKLGECNGSRSTKKGKELGMRMYDTVPYEAVELSAKNPVEYYKAWCETILGPEYCEKVFGADYKDKGIIESSPLYKSLYTRNEILTKICNDGFPGTIKKVHIYKNGKGILFTAYDSSIMRNQTGNYNSYIYHFFNINDKYLCDYFPRNFLDPLLLKIYPHSSLCLVKPWKDNAVSHVPEYIDHIRSSKIQTLTYPLESYLVQLSLNKNVDSPPKSLSDLLGRLCIYEGNDRKILWFFHRDSSEDEKSADSEEISGIYGFVVNKGAGIPAEVIIIDCNDYKRMVGVSIGVHDVSSDGRYCVGERVITDTSGQKKGFSYLPRNLYDSIEGLVWRGVSDDKQYFVGTLTRPEEKTTYAEPSPNEEDSKGKGKEKITDKESAMPPEILDLLEESQAGASSSASVGTDIPIIREKPKISFINVGFLRTPHGYVQLDPLPYARSCAVNHMSGDASIACGESNFPDKNSYDAYQDHLSKKVKHSDGVKEPSCLPVMGHEEEECVASSSVTGDVSESTISRKRKYEGLEKVKEKEREGEPREDESIDQENRPEENSFTGCVKPCIWLLPKEGSSESIVALELEIPEGCTFSRAKKCSSDGRHITGQYLVPGSTNEFHACEWRRDNESHYRFHSLRPEGYNYSNAGVVNNDNLWCPMVFGCMGNVNTTIGPDFGKINPVPVVWLNSVPTALNLGDSAKTGGITKFTFHMPYSGQYWVLGDYGGTYSLAEGGLITYIGGKPFITRGPNEEVKDLKEWLLENYPVLKEKLGNLAVQHVLGASKDGNRIIAQLGIGLFVTIDLSNSSVGVLWGQEAE